MQACASHCTAAPRTGKSAECGAAILKQCVESWYPRELIIVGRGRQKRKKYRPAYVSELKRTEYRTLVRTYSLQPG